jgi:uncharacterized coiled-coil protein SlyX
MQDDSPGLDRRMEVLETQFAYQEEAVSKMSALVWDLSRRMDRLEALSADMRRKLAEVENSEPNPSADQKPPHY